MLVFVYIGLSWAACKLSSLLASRFYSGQAAGAVYKHRPDLLEVAEIKARPPT